MKDFIRFLRIYFLRILSRICSRSLDIHGSILIIAPHPDDEVFGCSGLIQRCQSRGEQVFICVLTGGEKSHEKCCNIAETELKLERRKLAKTINAQLGVSKEHLILLDFPDGKISFDCEECSKLNELICKIQPKNVFIPHNKAEGWSDHIESGNIIKRLVKGKDIYLYEYCVWFWYYNVYSLHWNASCKITMTEQEHRNKLKAIHDYITPLAPCGKPYSGVLPPVFIRGNQWKNELYFKLGNQK